MMPFKYTMHDILGTLGILGVIHPTDHRYAKDPECRFDTIELYPADD